MGFAWWPAWARLISWASLIQGFGVGALLLVGLTGPAGAATRRALLVGVADYDRPGLSLSGPGNDVALMQHVLQQLGFDPSKVVTLASDADPARRPTRANILGALDRLAAESGPGDLVYLHLSGHGSQEPAGAGSSKLRDVQVFLPQDVGEWNDAEQVIGNGIPDWQFAEAITRIRNGGARVWAVFDTCHAGTMGRRSLEPPGERVRAVQPSSLGVPLGAPGRPLPPPVPLRPGAGDMVAFYAVQPDELASEREVGGLTPPRIYGVFTWRLAQALLASPGASFRQLSQRLLAEYGAMNETRTPLFEGSLDQSLQSAQPAALRQWPLGRNDDGGLQVPAGALNGLKPGTRLLVLPDPAAEASAALGWVTVREVGAVQATVDPVAGDGRAAFNPLALPPRAFARVLEEEPGFDLVVAPPEADGIVGQADAIKATVGQADAIKATVGPADGPERRLRDAAARLRDSPAGVARVRWAARGEGAEARLLIADGRLWLLPADGRPATLVRGAWPSLGAEGTDAELDREIAAMLSKAARAHGLLRAMAILAEPPSRDADAPQLGIKMALQPAGEPSTAKCRDAPAGTAAALDLSVIPKLRHCDRLRADLTNGGDRPVDVTVLYMDATYGIQPMFPRNGQTNRIEPGRSLPLTVRVRALEQDGSASTTGRERLLVIAVSARPGSERADFTWLAQGSTRGAMERRGALAGFLGQATAPTRGVEVTVAAPQQDATGVLLSWDLLPGLP